MIHQIHDHQLHSWLRHNIRTLWKFDYWRTCSEIQDVDFMQLHLRHRRTWYAAKQPYFRQRRHISAKGGIWVFRPTSGTWFRCKAAIFPPKAAYGSLDLLCSIIRVYEQWLIAIRFSRAGKGRSMAGKPGIDDLISDQSTASTSGKS